MDFQKWVNQALSVVQQSGLGDKKTLSKVGGGALGGTVASLFLKKKHRKTLIQVGSVAALGALAYYGYRNWQNKKATETNTPVALLPPSAFEWTGEAANHASQVILRAMVAAALADGEIDANERAIIEREAGDDAHIYAWLAQEVAHPATVNDLARAVGNNPALAAEVYLAARMVCADLSRREMVFLLQLSQALGLEEDLIEMLEQQAGF